MNMREPSYKKTAVLITAVILLLLFASVLIPLLRSRNASAGYTAFIYQDGVLIRSIDLSAVTESYTFDIISADGGINTIEVRPGSIGIITADCPDKLCVHQGFIRSDTLPITCLPHRLVIELHAETQPDMISY